MTQGQPAGNEYHRQQSFFRSSPCRQARLVLCLASQGEVDLCRMYLYIPLAIVGHSQVARLMCQCMISCGARFVVVEDLYHQPRDMCCNCTCFPSGRELSVSLSQMIQTCFRINGTTTRYSREQDPILQSELSIHFWTHQRGQRSYNNQIKSNQIITILESPCHPQGCCFLLRRLPPVAEIDILGAQDRMECFSLNVVPVLIHALSFIVLLHLPLDDPEVNSSKVTQRPYGKEGYFTG